MDPERWKAIEAWYHAAGQRDPSDRAAFLASALEDPEVRREVEALLTLEPALEGFLERPALELAAAMVAADRRPLPFRLGPYEMLEAIGHGGMGQVFRARDLRLHRQVALKLLPDHLAGHGPARSRLRREAVSAAALDHPFICKIFEVVEHDGVLLIVMELIDGETLADRLRRPATDSRDVLRLAGEIAEALEAAHARGIVHRDLKPGNIMVTTGGRIKVMDFGLACKLDDARRQDPDRTPGDVITHSRLGTPAYMSPEQINDDPVDPRSDIFTFGIVLCELLTGEHPFRRATAEATIAAIAHEPPQIRMGGEVPPGVGPILRRMLAKTPAERYQAVGELRADMQQQAELSARPSFPQPPAPRSGRWPLVGREQELAALSAHLARAADGTGTLVLVSGEPGIGKSRLTQALVATAQARGFFATIGHCREAEGTAPYAPFADIFERLFELLPATQVRSVLGDAGGEIARLMPTVTQRDAPVTAAAEFPLHRQRRAAFNACRDVVRRIGRVQPLVFVLEDLHWADEPTLLLMQHLAEDITALPLLMIGTYRDVELERLRPFARTLERLVRERLTERMTLRPLPMAAVESLLAAMSGQPPPDRLTHAVYLQTEGNPFFVEEVFQHLREEGKLFTADGSWQSTLRVADVQVPEGVRLVLRRRLDRLSPATARVLTTAAIIGQTFSVTLLELLCADAPEPVADAIEEAEAARLVEPGEPGREPRYRFVHALVRQSMMTAVSLPRRQRLHARVAEAMERLYAGRLEKHAPALAHHLLEAGAATDSEKAWTFVVMAADLARRAAAYEEALAYLDAALALVEDETSVRAGELHERRADVLRSLGQFETAAAAYERALDLYDAVGDPVRLAAATFPLTLIYAWNADTRRHLAATTRALDRLRDTSPALRCRVLFLHALGLTASADIEGGLAALDEAKRLRAQIEDLALDTTGAVLEVHVHYHAMQIPRAASAGRRAMELCVAAGDVWGIVDMQWHQVMAAIYLARPAEARQLIEAARPQAERVGHHNVVWFYQLLLASLALADGSLDDAAAHAQRALALGEECRIPWNFSSELALGQVAFYRGETDVAISHYRRAIVMEPSSYWSGLSRSALFAALAQTGSAEALAVLHEVPLRLPVLNRANAFGTWVSLTHIIEGLAWTGRFDDAAALHPAAEALIATGVKCFRDMRLYRTSAAIAAECAGEWALADAHFDAALDQAEAAPLRIAQAHARLWRGRLLRQRGPDAAGLSRVLLEQAVSSFESLNMPTFAAAAGRAASDVA